MRKLTVGTRARFANFPLVAPPTSMERLQRLTLSVMTCMIVLLAHHGNSTLRERRADTGPGPGASAVFRGIERSTPLVWLLSYLLDAGDRIRDVE